MTADNQGQSCILNNNQSLKLVSERKSNRNKIKILLCSA